MSKNKKIDINDDNNRDALIDFTSWPEHQIVCTYGTNVVYDSLGA